MVEVAKYVHSRIASSYVKVIPILVTHLTGQDIRFPPSVPYDIWQAYGSNKYACNHM